MNSYRSFPAPADFPLARRLTDRLLASLCSQSTAVLVSTLGGGGGGAWEVGTFVLGPAAAFTVGQGAAFTPDGDCTLASVVLQLSGSTPGRLTAELYRANAAHLPVGPRLVRLSTAGRPEPMPTPLTFTADSAHIHAGGTEYVVVLQGAGLCRWHGTVTPPRGAGRIRVGAVLNYDGAGWGRVGLEQQWLQLEVNVTAAAEPAWCWPRSWSQPAAIPV
jgi:hypothetical protein